MTKVTRERDNPLDPETRYRIRLRLIRTWGGLIVCISACISALLHPESQYVAFIVALIGAGLIEPNHIFSIFKQGK